jgi:hypothetical protein
MPKIIEHDGKKYEYVPDTNIGSCVRCIAMSDKIMCAALGAHCEYGYFIEKRGPGRPRKE